MIVVNIELWPGGIEEAKQDLGAAIISNDGTGDATLANYNVRLLKGARYSRNNAGSVYKRGRVEAYPRRLGPWPLLERAIRAALRS